MARFGFASKKKRARDEPSSAKKVSVPETIKAVNAQASSLRTTGIVSLHLCGEKANGDSAFDAIVVGEVLVMEIRHGSKKISVATTYASPRAATDATLISAYTKRVEGYVLTPPPEAKPSGSAPTSQYAVFRLKNGSTVCDVILDGPAISVSTRSPPVEAYTSEESAAVGLQAVLHSLQQQGFRFSPLSGFKASRLDTPAQVTRSTTAPPRRPRRRFNLASLGGGVILAADGGGGGGGGGGAGRGRSGAGAGAGASRTAAADPDGDLDLDGDGLHGEHVFFTKANAKLSALVKSHGGTVVTKSKLSSATLIVCDTAAGLPDASQCSGARIVDSSYIKSLVV